jgi:endonuclease/exonuclease/phosphatase family metal-dependent hydrolase
MHTFRLVTLNLMGMGAPIERRLELVASGLSDLNLDAIALQEVCEQVDQVPNQAATVAERLGYQHVFSRAKGDPGGVEEGLAILSRHPVRDVKVWPLPSAEGGRIVQQAVVEAPGGPVILFNTHLDYHPDNGVMRERQVVALMDIIRAHLDDHPGFVTGDFNATPEHDEIRFLRGRHTLQGRRAYMHDAYARVHPIEDPAGETWAKRNPLTRQWRWLEPDRRIDFIFVSSIESTGRGEVRSCRVVLDQPDDQGLFPSDHFGVLADIQLSPGELPR